MSQSCASALLAECGTEAWSSATRPQSEAVNHECSKSNPGQSVRREVHRLAPGAPESGLL